MSTVLETPIDEKLIEKIKRVFLYENITNRLAELDLNIEEKKKNKSI